MTSFSVTFDAAEPHSLAAFWAVALGYELQPPPSGYATWDEFADAQGIPAERRGDIAAVVDPTGRGPRLLFLRVPEPKTAKNRVHLDVHASAPDDDVDAAAAAREAKVAELVAAGATRVDDREGFGARWVVLTDPEGNEFCVV